MIIYDNNEISPYNVKYHQNTERELEIAFGLYFWTKFKNIIEVGAVLPYHFDNITHDIVDLYDKYPKCIRKDALTVDYTGKNVLSISTVEHMGTHDYDNVIIDEDYPIKFLNKVKTESKNFLITFPMNYHKKMQEYFFQFINTNYKILCKTNGVWDETNRLDIPYDFVIYRARCILVYSNLIRI